MESHFLAYLYRLRYIERWSLMRNVVKENVAEHSFHVALLTHALCTIAREVYGKPVAVETAVARALYHDITEVFTGDIPTPVKHHNSRILDSFREIETVAAERISAMLPDGLREAYVPYLESKGHADELSVYIKAADLLDAYLKCVSETSAGNREFAAAGRQILASVRKLQLPEADYFLEHFAPSFEKSLDELSADQ